MCKEESDVEVRKEKEKEEKIKKSSVNELVELSDTTISFLVFMHHFHA